MKPPYYDPDISDSDPLEEEDFEEDPEADADDIYDDEYVIVSDPNMQDHQQVYVDNLPDH